MGGSNVVEATSFMIKIPSKFLSWFAAFLLAISMGNNVHAAYVLYTFDTTLDGNGSFTTAVTGSDGFIQASAVSYGGTKPSQTGGSSYVDPLGNTWVGSGGASAPGHSLGWGDPSQNNYFSVTLETTNLESLFVRLDVRSANTGTAVRSAFNSFTYSVNGGAGTAIDVPLSFQTSGNAFYEWTADLSSIVALNNQSSVTLKWYVPDLSGYGSLRIDNLEITATKMIPEASTSIYAAMAGAIGLCAASRRRRH